jgi:hypothetical protein
MPSALRGAKVKKAIYERAHKGVSQKAVAAPAASSSAAADPPGYYEEDEYTKRHPWSSPAFY